MIVVITKRDITRDAQLAAMTKVITDRGFPSDRIIPVSDVEGGNVGTRELMELSHRILPEAYRNAFMAAQQVKIDKKVEAVLKKKEEAVRIIKLATTAASGIGLVPIPFSDAFLITPTQLTMIASLAGLYAVDRSEIIKNAVLPLVARSVGVTSVTTLTKFIPFAGSLINAGVAGALTAAMGYFVQQRLEAVAIAQAKGEKPPTLSFDIAQFKVFFEQYKKLQ